MLRILYLTPDYDIPSWGVGLLYHHVRILCESGFDACVLHQRDPFRLSWLDVEVPIRYLDATDFCLDPQDTLVVPEVMVQAPGIRDLPCRRVVFVQSSFAMFNHSETAFDFAEIGYQAAMAAAPHIAEVVETHCGLTPTLVPVFVAPYFFIQESQLDQPRAREVLLFNKPQYGQAGYPDYDIARKLLQRHFSKSTVSGQATEWKLVELEGRTHQKTAVAMKRAAFFVNLNVLEGFNVTVVEAMAAGCIPLCYEAFGGRDYLKNGENAYSFTNNHVYSLVEKVIELTDTYDARSDDFTDLRRHAFSTALRYQESDTAQALRRFFQHLTRDEQ